MWAYLKHVHAAPCDHGQRGEEAEEARTRHEHRTARFRCVPVLRAEFEIDRSDRIRVGKKRIANHRLLKNYTNFERFLRVQINDHCTHSLDSDVSKHYRRILDRYLF